MRRVLKWAAIGFAGLMLLTVGIAIGTSSDEEPARDTTSAERAATEESASDRACSGYKEGTPERQRCEDVNKTGGAGPASQVGEEAADGPGVSGAETFTRANYETLVTNPGEHEGAEVRIVGQVLSVERDADGTYFQMYADPENSEWNTVVRGESGLRVREDDYVRVRGFVGGEFEGTNAFGAELSAPIIEATRVQKVTAAALHPARKRLPSRSATQAGVTITVQKVELAADQTRVYIKATNNSGASFSMDTDPSVVAGGEQIEQKYTGEEYPELSSEVDAGASTRGVLIYPKISTRASLAITFKGYDADYDEITWPFRW
jgi:hypothetical protein